MAIYMINKTIKLFLILMILITLLCIFTLLFRSPYPNTFSTNKKHNNDLDPTPHKDSPTNKDAVYYYSFIDPKTNKNQTTKFNGHRIDEKIVTIKNYPKYYEDNLHPNWNFKISRNYESIRLREWSEPPRIINKFKQSQGENGTAFIPSSVSEKAEMKSLINKHYYNIYASEQISLRRSLPDYRSHECRRLTYPEKLPTTSIIIVFHNEAWSTVLRTVWSIIDRSPLELVHEIILVDDVSTWSFLKRPLDDYVKLLPVNIKIIRTRRREGLIRARLIGARIATGSVLTFFDAHIECTEGWLQPLLARIANDRSVVAVPKIDGISSWDMSYHQDAWSVNGLQWDLLFTTKFTPERELKRTKYDKTAPLRTATHVGCAFSVDREFFFEIGSYDEKMDIWGSENVELAFRVWMCGGSLEILPCSSVGHLYRISTYSFNGDKNKIKARNNARVVEVWMDEFKEFFYAVNPEVRNVLTSDLTERKNLRKQLKCKSFRWYLENIYPESTMLKNYTVMGEIINGAEDVCLESGQNYKLVVNQCHGSGENQFFALASTGHLLTFQEYCVGFYKGSVSILQCSNKKKTQLWSYNKKTQWIIHRDSNLCLQKSGKTVALNICSLLDARFQWEIEVEKNP